MTATFGRVGLAARLAESLLLLRRVGREEGSLDLTLNLEL